MAIDPSKPNVQFLPGASPLNPISRRKLSDEVVTRLESAIREGTFRPGSPLPSERELMQLFDVGRPSVREALYALQRIGLVRLVSGERAMVIEPSPKHLLNELGSTVRHLLEQPGGLLHFEQGRLFLELSLVRYACLSATDQQIDRLEEVLLDNEAAQDDPDLFRSTDVAFHRVLAEMPGNPVFIAMHDAIVEWLIAQRKPMREPSTQCRASFLGHRSIYNAIRARNAQGATDAMEAHLAEATKHYQQD